MQVGGKGGEGAVSTVQWTTKQSWTCTPVDLVKRNQEKSENMFLLILV